MKEYSVENSNLRVMGDNVISRHNNSSHTQITLELQNEGWDVLYKLRQVELGTRKDAEIKKWLLG